MSLIRFARAVARPAMAAIPRTNAAVCVSAPSRSVGNVVVPAPAGNTIAGRQEEELALDSLDGVGGFNDAPAEGPFGTIAKPVRIYSSFHSRIVGCKGGDDSKHRMSWFELKAGKKHVCTECGQVFQLVNPAGGVKESAH